jgi:hypothetical protein
VLAIEPLLPSLQELHLCGNRIASLAPPEAGPEAGPKAGPPTGPEARPEADAAGAEEAGGGHQLAPVTGFASLQVGSGWVGGSFCLVGWSVA